MVLSPRFLRFLYFSLHYLIRAVHFFRLRLWKYDLTEHDIVQSRVPTNPEAAVQGSEGRVGLTAAHLKRPAKVYRLELEDGAVLEAADSHLVASGFGYCQTMHSLRKGDWVQGRQGQSRVKSCRDTGRVEFLFDLTVASEDKLYWSGDVLSHNSIVSAIFIVWYLLNHSERNVMCVSQNGDKVKELMDKIAVILKGLPFYMKLGTVTDNIMTKVFDNDCKLVAQTTTENSGASFTIHLLYCDEFALVNANYIREFYRAVYPTLTSSDISRMIITSTPRGMNKFYEIYRDAVESKSQFNPIRVDWYEIEGRDEDWKLDQIAQLGSEDDFNQEFGNQFLSGSSLLLKTAVLKRMKNLQTNFVHRRLDAMEDLGIDYEGVLTWHPAFDMKNLRNKACRFVWSHDLGGGNGGDYTVLSLWQLLLMSAKEIESLRIFGEDQDFIKLVQVGQFRSNQIELPQVAQTFYHTVVDVMDQELTKVVLELNHEGKYFMNLVNGLYGPDNEIEDDHLWATFGATSRVDSDSQKRRSGLLQTTRTKEQGGKLVKDQVGANQLVPTEFNTIEEAVSFSKDKAGNYGSQTGHDDCFMTVMNLTHYRGEQDFTEQVDELLDFAPKSFKKLVATKLKRVDYEDEDDDYGDLL